LVSASWDESARLWDLSALTREPRDVSEELAASVGLTLRGASAVFDSDFSATLP